MTIKLFSLSFVIVIINIIIIIIIIITIIIIIIITIIIIIIIIIVLSFLWLSNDYYHWYAQIVFNGGCKRSDSCKRNGRGHDSSLLSNL